MLVETWLFDRVIQDPSIWRLLCILRPPTSISNNSYMQYKYIPSL